MFFGINDAFHFSTDGDDFNTVKNGTEEFVLGKVETVHVLSKENRVLILTRDSQTTDYLFGFDLEGQLLFKVEPPEHYHFWYLSGKQVACTEADDQAKKSPLSGWWFSIDLLNGNMEMGSPAY
ncbi:hypothetical protein ABE41_006360 [Fictibacillus arsenicus]|uniref:Uncharacterized protein n=1 Tax=Fictibacillus arsenicus TaxID=255247 RepID=A0A1B1Z2J1_9BACL|nr:hypothetical protein [Fictibacillus arsenicus]ANX11624.1 hypothetical protein ABE41_006360 [Fictibacillus arsenicus]